ncbi:MAG: UPF0175 family protein [Candidatus Kapaibacterium sp.]
MKALTVKIPENIDEFDIKMIIASQLFAKGLVSSGQAAEIAGISKRQFLEKVGEFEISIFGESPEDIERIINE